jgi:hypothetical protein
MTSLVNDMSVFTRSQEQTRRLNLTESEPPNTIEILEQNEPVEPLLTDADYSEIESPGVSPVNIKSDRKLSPEDRRAQDPVPMPRKAYQACLKSRMLVVETLMGGSKANVKVSDIRD